MQIYYNNLHVTHCHPCFATYTTKIRCTHVILYMYKNIHITYEYVLNIHLCIIGESSASAGAGFFGLSKYLFTFSLFSISFSLSSFFFCRFIFHILCNYGPSNRRHNHNLFGTKFKKKKNQTKIKAGTLWKSNLCNCSMVC